MNQKISKLFILALALLSSCSKADIEYKYPENPDIVRKSRAGKFFNSDLVLFGKNNNQISAFNSKNTKDVNYPLWLASLEVVGNLFPIATADANSGLIITDWYQDSGSDKTRAKINLMVKSKEIKDESLMISIFRQKKDSKGNWQDDKLDQGLAVKLIKEKIIQEAKQK